MHACTMTVDIHWKLVMVGVSIQKEEPCKKVLALKGVIS